VTENFSYQNSISGKDLQNSSAPQRLRKKREDLPYDPFQSIRRLIWLYIILWLIEGGLRRWFLPGLATPLLVIRDPIAIAIYGYAWSKGVFPKNLFVVFGIILFGLEIACAIVLGHGNLPAAIYGARCDFLHIPMIFIIGKVLTHKQLTNLCKWTAWIAIPYSAILIMQFYSPQDAWINRGVGGSLEGAGFDGAMGRYRPPGTFSFISGPTLLYPLLTACWWAVFMNRKVNTVILIASLLAIVIAIPVSISRGLFIGVLLVMISGLAAMISKGRISLSLVIQVAAILIAVLLLSNRIPAFKDGMEAFGSRWEASTTNQGGVKTALLDRFIDGLFQFASHQEMSLFGAGSGYSTNVGQMMIASTRGFGGSEGEWGRLTYDNGVVLGGIVILYRIALALWVLKEAIKGWSNGYPMALAFAAASILPLLNGQWGQASSLGASVIAGGLTLAAAEVAKKPLRHPDSKSHAHRFNRKLSS